MNLNIGKEVRLGYMKRARLQIFYVQTIDLQYD